MDSQEQKIVREIDTALRSTQRITRLLWELYDASGISDGVTPCMSALTCADEVRRGLVEMRQLMVPPSKS